MYWFQTTHFFFLSLTFLTPKSSGV